MLSIRKMQAKDKEFIQEMIETMIGGPNVSRTAELEMEKYCNQQDFHVIVAEIESNIVGFGVIKNNPFEGGDGISELGLFQIKKEYRNQGIGTKLLASIEQSQVSASIRKIYTKTNPKNLHAVCYWLKHGFEFEARLYKMNVDTDYYLLSKELAK
jgi:N-acetylglutamate synthase-like GNAT family acetyltransferase